jgi:pimeloyl-ACP methyl ester carboxylesterase
MPLPLRLRRPLRIAGISLAALLAAFCVVPYLIPLPGGEPVAAEALAQPGGRFVTIEGTRTFVVEAGPKDGPAVVLVHGFGGSTFSFRKNVGPLGAAGFHAVSIDLRGFGLSDKRWDAEYSHGAQADFLVAAMKELGIPRASFVGHSLGGNIVAHVAERHPEAVEKVVFIAPVVLDGRAPGDSAWALRFPPVRRWAQIVVRTRLKPPGTGNFLRTGYGDPSLVTKEVVEGYAAPRWIKDWDLALLGIARDTGKNRLPRPVSELHVPVLILWGDKDKWVPISRGEALRKKLPRAEWTAVPGAGHLLMEEKPEEVNARLVEFLRR